MTALHRVKAYFGMVPPDELDAYDGYDDPRYDDARYDDARYEDRRDDRRSDDRRADDRRSDDRRYDDRRRYEPERHEGRYADRYEDRYDDRFEERRDGARRSVERSELERYPADRSDRPRASSSTSSSTWADDADGSTPAPRPRDPRDPEVPESRREESEVETQRSSRGRSWASNTGPNHTSVRPTSVPGTRSTPSLSPLGSSPSGSPGGLAGATRGALAVDASRDVGNTAESTNDTETSAPAEITSLQPTSYNEARVIGERYRDGIPVIMNLTDMDEVAAKRLVDFAAGLAFALRGSIEKVTNRVFLLSPPNVEVSAAERRKLAESSYSTRS